MVMRREPVPGPMARWQPWRWVLADVVVVQRPDGSRLPYWPVAAGAPVALQADELGHTEGDLAPVSCSS
ncbi:hypothetical protein [Tepidimonas charontis]|uniref:hypothetical protein n=1 Tax=Tepidimonas charontis TaxID=2267262 RepID=UPI002E261D90